MRRAASCSGELLDQVDFAVEMKNFGGEGAAFGFAGGEVSEERGEGGGWCGGASDET